MGEEVRSAPWQRGKEEGNLGRRRTMVPTSSGVPGSTLQADWAELCKAQWALSAVYRSEAVKWDTMQVKSGSLNLQEAHVGNTRRKRW